MVHQVANQTDFDEQVRAAAGKLVVVDFFATWCGPCKVIAPHLEKLSQTLAESLVVLKVDVDECEELAVKFNISSMPTFIFLKNGEQIDVFSGANPDRLEKTIQQHIAL